MEDFVKMVEATLKGDRDRFFNFLSLVKKMREAQKIEIMLTGDEDMEFIGNAVHEARKSESEVDEYLKKMEV